MTIQPTERRRYIGDLSLRSGRGVLKVALTGQGDLADLAGSYALTRRSIDPPGPSDPSRVVFCETVTQAVTQVASPGIDLRARTDCARPDCGYIYHFATAGLDSPSPVDPFGDGTFAHRWGDSILTLRPQRIENGRVTSLVLAVAVAAADDGYTVTVTFDGTRRA